MANLYVGTGTNQHTANAADILRSGYNKIMAGNNLDSQMGHNDVTAQTANATGTAWGAFTACGGVIIKTANDVYLLHSSQNNYLYNQWTGNFWLHNNQANITQAVLIQYGNNIAGNHNIMTTIRDYLADAQRNIPFVRIVRNNTNALRASASLNGVFIMNGANYAHPVLNRTWVNINQVNEAVNQ